MTITGTIQEWAIEQARRLKESRDIESRIEVGRRAGLFPSQHAKDLRMTQINSQIHVYELVAGLEVLDESCECEFCGEPATKVEEFDRQVHVCDQCHAE